MRKVLILILLCLLAGSAFATTCNAPTLSPVAGTYSSTQNVSINSANCSGSFAVACVTVDGSNPLTPNPYPLQLHASRCTGSRGRLRGCWHLCGRWWRCPGNGGEIEKLQQVRLRGFAWRQVLTTADEAVLHELDYGGVVHGRVRDVVPAGEGRNHQPQLRRLPGTPGMGKKIQLNIPILGQMARRMECFHAALVWIYLQFSKIMLTI